MRKQSEEKPNRRLLILSCSARKHPVTGKVVAWELYDGVAFRVVKRLQREGRFPNDVDILILSARYGLIRPNREIAFYDQRMTRDIALHQVTRNRALLHRLLRSGHYKEVFINAGQTYLAALQKVESWLPEGVKLTIAEGSIGRKMQQMKVWLLSNNDGGPFEPTGRGRN